MYGCAMNFTYRDPDARDLDVASEAVRRAAAAMAAAMAPDAPPVEPHTDPGPAHSELAVLRALDRISAMVAERSSVVAYRAGRAGATFTDLGAAVGVSRQAATKRWPDAVPAPRFKRTPATGTAAYTPQSRAWELTDRVRTHGKRMGTVAGLLMAFGTAATEHPHLVPAGDAVAAAWTAGGEAAVDAEFAALEQAALGVLRTEGPRERAARMQTALDDLDYTGDHARTWMGAAARAWAEATRLPMVLSPYEDVRGLVPRGLAGLDAAARVLDTVLGAPAEPTP